MLLYYYFLTHLACLRRSYKNLKGLFLILDIWIMHLETFWPEGNLGLTDEKTYVLFCSSHV